jgi:hypothetical protein
MTAIQVNIGVSEGLRNLGLILSRNRLRDMSACVADTLARKISAYIGRRAPTRHKSAARLGAKPTGVLEFIAGNPSRSRGGGIIEGVERNGEAVITIDGVPGISRAFHDLHITPKKAKALTIPINAMSYAKSAADMERMGWRLFVPRRKGGKRSGVLMGQRGSRRVALFAFAQSVTIKHDPYLLPSRHLMSEWANKAAIESFKEVAR